MNKLYSLLLVLLLLAGKGMAQNAASGNLPVSPKSYTNVKAGLNFTNFRGGADGGNMQVGANAGFYVLYMESRYFGIQPELQYSLQGAKSDQDHLFMHYAVVPIMLKVFPNPAFSIQAGPYAGFLLSSKYKSEGYDAQYTGKGQDYGFAYGLSFGNEGKITLSARHHVGLAKLSKNSSLKNQAFQVSVGVCISKK